MKKILLPLLLLFGCSALQAASLVEGRLYLKTGETIDFTDGDRIEIPRKNRPLRTFRDAFRKTKRRTAYRPDQIDSVVLWHPRNPGERHTFLPTRAGWCRLFFATPALRALIYSRKGYTIFANGGTVILFRNRLFSSSAVELYLQKLPDGDLYSPGRLNRTTSDAFRRRIAGFVADDPVTAGRIRRSNTSRDKTVLLLTDYLPLPSNP